MFEITAGANLAYESGDYISSEFHIYPHLRTQVELLTDEVSVYAQLTGNMKMNTLSTYSGENEFLTSTTPMMNTREKANLSAGINAKISRELITAVSASVSRQKNMPYFYNLYMPREPVKFSVLYDDVNVFNLHAELKYIQGEKMTIGAMVDFNSYDNDSLAKPLYKPGYRAGINSTYTISDKIYIKADIGYNGPVYGFNYEPGSSGFIRLKEYVDANLGIDYRYSKILSAFIQVNNIGMQRYFHWYNYPVYRLNAMAGITYSFL